MKTYTVDELIPAFEDVMGKDYVDNTAERGEETREDLMYYIDEAKEPLEYLGITVGEDFSLTTELTEEQLKEKEQIVTDALEILESDEDLAPHRSQEAKDYYLKFQVEYGDDVAFDSHGSYVQFVLDTLVSHLIMARTSPSL